MWHEVVWDSECFEQLQVMVAAGVPPRWLHETIRVIHDELSSDPSEKGTQLSEGLRRLDVTPLRAFFQRARA